MLHEFVVALLQRVSPQRLHLWAAGLYHAFVPPGLMTEVALTEPLRAPPAVTEQVEKARWIGGDIHPYSRPRCPLPTAGPEVRVVEHATGPGHQQGDLCHCLKCGWWSTLRGPGTGRETSVTAGNAVCL